MAALTQNSARSGSGGTFRRIPLAANAAPFQGSLLGYSSGLARPLVAGDKFAGLARSKPEPSAVAGLAKVEADTGIFTFRVAAVAGIASPSRSDIGTKVYASNDNDLTDAATGNTLIGAISDWDAASGFEITAVTADVRDAL